MPLRRIFAKILKRMLDINYLRANTEIAKSRLTKRNKYNISLIDEVLQLDDERKKLQTALDNTLSETNSTSNPQPAFK